MKKLKVGDIGKGQISNLQKTVIMLSQEFSKGYYNPNIVGGLLEEIQNSCEILKSENYEYNNIVTDNVNAVIDTADKMLKNLEEMQSKLNNLKY